MNEHVINCRTTAVRFKRVAKPLTASDPSDDDAGSFLTKKTMTILNKIKKGYMIPWRNSCVWELASFPNLEVGECSEGDIERGKSKIRIERELMNIPILKIFSTFVVY